MMSKSSSGSQMCRNGRTHADGRINGSKRRNCTERITADVAGNGQTQLLEHIECTSVRAACTHDRGSSGNGIDGCVFGHFLTEYSFCDHRGRIVADQREDILAVYVHAECLAVIFDDRVELFNDINFIALCGEVPEQINRPEIPAIVEPETPAIVEPIAEEIKNQEDEEK